jgi:hypothetical protein
MEGAPEGAVGDLGAHQYPAAIVSGGDAGDSFLATLSASYGCASQVTTMRPITEAYAISVVGSPEHGEHSPARLKRCFGREEDAETPCGELFLNRNLPNRALELKETDPEYRRVILVAPDGHNLPRQGR